MKKFSKKFSILFIIIFCSIFFSIKTAKCQDNHFIIYKSNFFSLHLEDGTYYGGEDYDLNLKIGILYDNMVENISLKLELFNREKNEISYFVEKRYFYYTNERAIYENHTKVGIIPIFIEENLPNNQEVILADFNNISLVGTHIEEEGSINLSSKKIPYHYVLIDEINYTAYYYSDFENILVFWEIGNSYDITLDNIFGLKSFYGHIIFDSTDYDWANYSILEYFHPIFIILIICIGFISVFFLIRRILILKDKILFF